MEKLPKRVHADSKKFSEILALVFYKLRFWLFGLVCATVLVLIAIFSIQYFIAERENKAVSEFTLLEDTFSALSQKLSNAQLGSGDAAQAEKDFLDKCLKLEKEYHGTYAYLRSLTIKADYFIQKKAYIQAADAYLAAANLKKEAYTGALSYFNAASMFENAGRLPEAKKYLQQLVQQYSKASYIIPAALCNLGRIAELEENKPEALSFYNDLAVKYPDSGWAKVAISRKIALELENQGKANGNSK